MAQLMLHREILKSFYVLPRVVQKRVAEMIELFQRNPADPALHLHSVKESMVDSKVRGANLPDGYRAIIIAPEKGDTYLLMHIDKHDDAYRWARNKRFEVHPKTGVFQVFDVEEVKASVAEPPPRKRNEYRLCELSDDELYSAGLPRELIPSVRAVDSDEAFEALAAYLPQDCREVLFGYACGMGLDEAIESVLGRSRAEEKDIEPAGPGDFSRLEQAPNFDLVLVEGENDLKEVLQKSLEEWRVFLHPSQRKLVNWDVGGPMCVTGAAGTGKTVALMHRAVRLTKQLKDSQERVLITTYTTNLPVTIKAQIAQLDAEALTKIEITNLHALARTICVRAGWQGKIAERDDINDIWKEVLSSDEVGELPLKSDDLKDEYRLVVDRNGIEDEESYLTTVRSGLPRLGREVRRKVWPVMRSFQRILKKRNLLTFEGAIHQARLSVEQGLFQRYAYVLVDEVQDFGLEALKLIRALSRVDEGRQNPLAVFGDGHQRIYGNKVALSRAGIEVRGRSRRLRVNYRTSEQIRKWAHNILDGVEPDDLNGDMALTLGDRSVFKGPEPAIVRCSSKEAEAREVVKWVQHLLAEGKFATHEICITPNKSEIRSGLASAGIATRELRDREADPGSVEPGVRLGTMYRIKGLEFRAVIMACFDPADPLTGREAPAAERCLRYVAATRARERLLVTLPKP